MHVNDHKIQVIENVYIYIILCEECHFSFSKKKHD